MCGLRDRHNMKLIMGFKPWISGIGNDFSDNWATATSDFLFLLFFMSSPLQCRAQNATGSPLTSLDDVAVLVVLLHQPSVQVRILRPPEEEENLFVPERTRRRSPSFPDPITEIEIFRRRRNLKKWSTGVRGKLIDFRTGRHGPKKLAKLHRSTT